MKRILVVSILCVMFFSVQAFAIDMMQDREVYEKITKNFKVKPGSSMIVESDDGYVRINTWNKNEVEVIMHKRAWGDTKREAQRYLDDIEVELIQRDNRLYIRDVTDDHEPRNIGLLDLIRGNFHYGTTVDFEIMVPNKMDVDITADDGDVWVNDLEGELSVDVDDGDLEVEGVRTNRLEVSVDDGDIDLEDVSPSSSSGKQLLFISGDDNDVNLRRVTMETIEVEGDDGMITFHDVTVKNLEVDLDDGEFDGDLDVRNGGRIRVMVNDGDVTLGLPDKISAYFNLYTYGGRIRSDFPLDVEREEDKSWVKEKIGGGDINVRVEVDDGYIVLKNR